MGYLYRLTLFFPLTVTTSFFVSAFLFVVAFAFCVGVGLGLGLAGLFAFFTRRVVHASCTQRCPGGADGSDSF